MLAMKKTWSMLTLTAVLILGAANVSSASSIVFTKGGNVWRSSPDGHKRQLTRDGGYASPSQDDSGRVYAIQRGRFVRLSRERPAHRRALQRRRRSQRQRDRLRALGCAGVAGREPDRLLARRPAARRPVGGYTPYDLEDQVVVTRSDRFTPDSTFGYQRSYRDPSWVDNRELLVFNYGLLVEQAAFFAPKPVGEPSFGQWFSDPDVAQIGDGELTRDHSLLVLGAGGGLDLNNIAFYRMSENTPPEAPERVCSYHSKDGSTAYADPTFSPRGDAIAFAQDAPGKRADGVYVWTPHKCSGTAKLIARGAKDPDWGPANLR